MSFFLHPSSSKDRVVAAPHAVFGRDLDELLQVQHQPVPIIVQQTVQWLEDYALDEEGLFRISGNQSDMERMKLTYDRDPKLWLNFKDENLTSHTVAGLLKWYIRELPQPLCLYRYYSTFLKVQKNQDQSAQLKNFHLLINKLPKSNRDLLLFVLKFLNKVAQHSDKNMMTLSNLATCWAPNLLKDAKATAEQAMVDADTVTTIVITLIENVDALARDKLTNSSASSPSSSIYSSPSSPSSSSSLFSSSSLVATSSNEINNNNGNGSSTNMTKSETSITTPITTPTTSVDEVVRENMGESVDDVSEMEDEIKRIEQEIAQEEQQLAQEEATLADAC